MEPDLASGIPIRAIRIRPPGKVGIGSKEIQPKNIRVVPTRVKGCDHDALSRILVSPTILIPSRLTSKGRSRISGEAVIGTISGVSLRPSKESPIPQTIITIGTESADLPNELRSGHNLASLRGREAKPIIPNGHHSMAGPGSGNRCGNLTPLLEAVHF